MGLDLGTISASVGLNTSPLAADVVKAKAMFSGLDKSLAAGGMKNTEKGLAGLGNSLKSLSGFGGTATNSLGALGSQLGALGKIGIVAGAVIGLGAALFSCAKAAAEEQKIQAQTNAVIASTGGVANVTAAHVDEYGNSLAQLSGISHDVIKSAENIMLTFRGVQNVGKDKIFDDAIKSTLDMSIALGKDLSDSAIKVGKALQDPVKGLTALRRYGVMFTDEQVAMAKQMVATGDTIGAQKMILQELNTEFGKSAEALGGTLEGNIGKLKDSWDQLKESLGENVLPVATKSVSILASTVEEAALIIKNAKKDIGGMLIAPSKLNFKVEVDANAAATGLTGFNNILRSFSSAAGDGGSAADLLAERMRELSKDAADAMGNTSEALKELETELATGGLKTVTQNTFDSMIDSIKDASPGVRKEAYKMLDDVVGDIARHSPAMKAAGSDLMSGLEMAIEQAKESGVAVTNGFIVSTIQSMMATGTPEMQQAGAELIAALQSYFNGHPARPQASPEELNKQIASISKQINIPVVFNPETGQFETAKGTAQVPIGTTVTLNPITNRWEVAKTGAEQPVTTPTTFNPITGKWETAKVNAQGQVITPTTFNPLTGLWEAKRNIAQQRINTLVYFQPNTGAADAARARLRTPISTMFTITTQTKVNPIFSHPYQAGEYIGEQITAGATAANPMATLGTGVGSALSDLADATALANRTFDKFLKDMKAEPLNKVNDAIMRLTSNNRSSLGDWWKLQGAYDAATKSLANYTKQIDDAEKAVTSLEAARDRPSLVMDEKSAELQLAIMEAEDAQDGFLVIQLNLQKDLLDRKKEELDLVTSIADKKKDLEDTKAYAGLTTAEIDAQLVAKQAEVAALKITFDKVQTSVDTFKKIIDDLASYFTSKSPAPTGYASGTPYVAQTGMALVHKGEQIIPANLNPLVLGSGEATLITVPLYLDGKLIAKSVSRYQGGQANSRAMSGGRY